MATVDVAPGSLASGAGGGLPPKKGGPPGDHGEGHDDPNLRPCWCGKHIGPHRACDACGKPHKGKCTQRCTKRECGRNAKHTFKNCPRKEGNTALRMGIREALSQCRQVDRQTALDRAKITKKARRQHKTETRRGPQLSLRPKTGGKASNEASKKGEGAAGDSQPEEPKTGDDGKDEEMSGVESGLEESQPDPKQARKE